MSLDKAKLDLHFRKLRGKLFSLTEASVPGSQQESFKQFIKTYTQDAWSSIGKDAGFVEHERNNDVDS